MWLPLVGMESGEGGTQILPSWGVRVAARNWAREGIKFGGF